MEEEKAGKFHSLVKRHEGIAISSPEDKVEPRGPSFYVHDIELPIDGKDVDVIEATVKLKPTVTITERNGKKDFSYDFEVKAIKFHDVE